MTAIAARCPSAPRLPAPRPGPRSPAPRPAAPVHLPPRPCPVCGTPAPSMLAVLPSGRQAIIGACAVCGRQDAKPVADLQPQDRARLAAALR